MRTMQKFLLELGKGYSFIARQQRITIDGDHFYTDLVFYHVILKSYVIIDLLCGAPHKSSMTTELYQGNLRVSFLRDHPDAPIIPYILLYALDDKFPEFKRAFLWNCEAFESVLSDPKKLQWIIDHIKSDADKLDARRKKFLLFCSHYSSSINPSNVNIFWDFLWECCQSKNDETLKQAISTTSHCIPDILRAHKDPKALKNPKTKAFIAKNFNPMSELFKRSDSNAYYLLFYQVFPYVGEVSAKVLEFFIRHTDEN